MLAVELYDKIGDICYAGKSRHRVFVQGDSLVLKGPSGTVHINIGTEPEDPDSPRGQTDSHTECPTVEPTQSRDGSPVPISRPKINFSKPRGTDSGT